MGFLQLMIPDQLMAEQEGLIESTGPQVVDMKRDRDMESNPDSTVSLGRLKAKRRPSRKARDCLLLYLKVISQ